MRPFVCSIAALSVLLWAGPVRAQAPLYVGEWSAPGEPSAITIGPDGNLWVSIALAGVVRKYTPSGQLLLTLGAPGTEPGQFRFPLGVAIAPNGDVFVADFDRDRVLRFSGSGDFLSEFRPSVSGSDGHPSFILYHPTRQLLYITDNSLSVLYHTTEGESWGGRRLPYPDSYGLRGIVFTPSEEILVAAHVGGHVVTLSSAYQNPLQSTWYAGGSPNQIALDGSGRLWVTDFNGLMVRTFSSTGTPLFSFGGYGTGPGKFIGPSGIAIDGDGTIYVADKHNHRIQIFNYVVPVRPSSWGEVKGRYRRPWQSDPPVP